MSKWALFAIGIIAASYLAYVTAIDGWSDESIWLSDGFLFLMAICLVEIIDALVLRRTAQ